MFTNFKSRCIPCTMFNVMQQSVCQIPCMWGDKSPKSRLLFGLERLALRAVCFRAPPPRPYLVASGGRGLSTCRALSPRRGGTGPPAAGVAIALRRPGKVALIKGVRGQRRCRQPTRPVLKRGPRRLASTWWFAGPRRGLPLV